MHGVKKHNSPKDVISAVRKGNRDAEREMMGDGFKSKNKIHKTSKNDFKKSKKINLDKIDDIDEDSSYGLSRDDLNYMVKESVIKIIKNRN